MTKRQTVSSPTKAGDQFKLKKSRVFAPFDSTGPNSKELVWHEFKRVGENIGHIADGAQRALILKSDWPAYVKGNDAAAAACNYNRLD